MKALRACHTPAAPPGALVLAVALALAPAHGAHARTLVVDAAGGGDVTTIQQAADEVEKAVRQGGGEWADTILVRPGHYEEDVLVPRAAGIIRMRAAGGAEATSVRSIRPAEGAGAAALSARAAAAGAPWLANERWEISGLTLSEPVVLLGRPQLVFDGCVFEAEVRSETEILPAAFIGCTFRGDVIVRELCQATLTDCRFEGATLRAIEASGSSGCAGVVAGCVFTGPVDTAAVVRPAGDSSIRFERCRFENVGHGIVATPDFPFDEWIGIERCVFTDVSGVAVDWQPAGAQPAVTGAFGLAVTDSRFERCGRAIRWGGDALGTVSLERDTVLASGGTAVELGLRLASLFLYPGESRIVRDLVVDGAGGDGLVLHLADLEGLWGSDPFEHPLAIERPRIANVAGAAVRLARREQGAVPAWRVVVTDGALASNGAGIAGVADLVEVRGTMISGSDDAGLEVRLAGEFRRLELERATIVGSGGAGVRARTDDPAGYTAVVHRTLVATSGGEGLALVGAPAGSAAANDVWASAGAAFIGASPDSNLTLDPLFCDSESGDYRVSESSPCAASGPYGAIGALGVGCSAPATIEPRPRDLAAALVRPNPARGVVELLAPWVGGDAEVEILDLQGRMVWRAPAGAATPVRWTGTTARGDAARAGLYWVRWTRGAESSLRRLVWLR